MGASPRNKEEKDPARLQRKTIKSCRREDVTLTSETGGTSETIEKEDIPPKNPLPYGEKKGEKKCCKKKGPLSSCAEEKK